MHRIQVVDNGKGISRFNMNSVGIRYMTSKCQSLEDLKHNMKRYGFRGEALASIIQVSEKLIISSRLEGVNDTYTKTFENGKMSNVNLIKERPEHGTTVTVENFLQNMRVRQQRIRPDLDLDDIQQHLKHLAIIHPKISFSLRNDVSGKVILMVHKSNSVSKAFVNLFPDIEYESLSEFRVSKKHINISGIVYKGTHENKHLQLIYVNKRFIICPEIQKLIKKLYTKACNSNKNTDTSYSFDKNKHPVYILNICCSQAYVDFTLHPSKTTAIFKKLPDLLECIEKVFCKFWKIEPSNSLKQTEKSHGNFRAKSDYGVSIIGAVKSMPVKRKNVISVEQNPQKKTRSSEIESRDNSIMETGEANFLIDEQDAVLKEKVTKKPNCAQKFLLADNAQDEYHKNEAPDLFENALVDYHENNQLIQQTKHQPDDQVEGKNFIMGRFLKSLETYKEKPVAFESSGSHSDVLVQRTEKNLFAAKRDHNTTMTYSIKVQTERTIRKKSSKSKCLQTTFLEQPTYQNISKNNKISKCIQTCMDDVNQREASDSNKKRGRNDNANNENLLSVSQCFPSGYNENEGAFFESFVLPKLDTSFHYLQDLKKVEQKKLNYPAENKQAVYCARNFDEINVTIDTIRDIFNESVYKNVNAPNLTLDQENAVEYYNTDKLNAGFCAISPAKQYQDLNYFGQARAFNIQDIEYCPTEQPCHTNQCNMKNVFVNERQERGFQDFFMENDCREEIFKRNSNLVSNKNCKFSNTFNSHPHNNAQQDFISSNTPNKKTKRIKNKYEKEQFPYVSEKNNAERNDIAVNSTLKQQFQQLENMQRMDEQKSMYFKKMADKRRYLSLKKLCDQGKENTNERHFCKTSPDIISNSQVDNYSAMGFRTLNCGSPVINKQANKENLASKPFNELLKPSEGYKSSNARKFEFTGNLLGGNEKFIPVHENCTAKDTSECTVSTPRINESRSVIIGNTDLDITNNSNSNHTVIDIDNETSDSKSIELKSKIPISDVSFYLPNDFDTEKNTAVPKDVALETKDLNPLMISVDEDINLQNVNENICIETVSSKNEHNVPETNSKYANKKLDSEAGMFNKNIGLPTENDEKSCNIWEKCTDDFGGKYYLNERTGR